MRTTDKPFNITKKQVYEAYKAVKSNHGAAGVDKETIEQFEANLKGNLYKLWNRMSSGSYFPPPVRAVSIPKKSGGERILGVPTVADRVAQMVVKQLIEPDLDPIFLADSVRLSTRKIGTRCHRCHASALLEIRLGSRVRHQRSVRQHRSRTLATGCPEAREMQMGAALHRKMVEGADGARGWNEGGAYVWHPSRRCCQPDSRESVHALCVRSLDGTDISRAPMVSVC